MGRVKIKSNRPKHRRRIQTRNTTKNSIRPIDNKFTRAVMFIVRAAMRGDIIPFDNSEDRDFFGKLVIES